MQIVWSPEALDDLEKIWTYLAKESSVVRADDQIVKIEMACRTLSAFPLAGRSRASLIPSLRTIVAAPYIVFYRSNDDTIDIIRVLDGRRDVDAILAGIS